MSLLAALALSSTTATIAAAPPSVLEQLRFDISGYVQADAVLYDQSSVDELDSSTGAPLNDTRFLIRRARLRAEASYRFASALVEIDGNTVSGPAMRLIAAEVSLSTEEDGSLPLLAASLGFFKIPFGYEVPERFEKRLFIDASTMANGLFESFYDLGIKLHGGWRFLRYQIAAINGDPEKKNKDVLGRLGVEVELVENIRIEAGISALTGKGFHAGTPSTKDVIIWRDLNENGLIELTELQAISGSAGTPSATFTHEAMGGDLRVTAEIPGVGPLVVFGELIFARNMDRSIYPADPIALGHDLRERGFLAGFTQTFFDVAMLGVRYDHYNPDADAADRQGAELVPVDVSYSTWAVAAAWLPLDGVRVIAEYAHRDNALGRNAAGEPARLADDSFTLRAQMGFR